MKYKYLSESQRKRRMAQKNAEHVRKMISERNRWKNDTLNELKSSVSKWEKNVISYFQNRSIKVCSQYPVMYNNHLYFIDIYVPSVKCGIEVDGGYHLTCSQMEKDRERTNIINKVGIRIERIYNEETTYKWALQELYKRVLRV